MRVVVPFDADALERLRGYSREHPVPNAELLRLADTGEAWPHDKIAPHTYATYIIGAQGVERLIVAYTVEEHAPGQWLHHLSLMPIISIETGAPFLAAFDMSTEQLAAAESTPGETAIDLYQVFPEFVPP